MKRLPNRLLLCLALSSLPLCVAAATVTTVCSAVQAAGLSLPERHVAAKMEAEAALDGASQRCSGSAVQVMAEPADNGAPLRLQDANAPQSPDDSTASPAQSSAATGELPELPAEVLVHWAHAAPLATPAVFTGLLPLAPHC
ncbi:hypothetical protein [Cupriavidus sp. DF5525]|uniref:hypothetical protein n=1 Tax=Cupriavidus sp. DF5525 TaxID=3160989 RepID=UPI0003AFFE6D|nr:hypothetical protein N234_29870 [Ralstonia pickettii DTP0602]